MCIMRKYSFIAVAFTLALCGCNTGDNIDGNEKTAAPTVYHLSIQASMDSQTKGVTFDPDGERITSRFEVGDKIYVYNKTQDALARHWDDVKDTYLATPIVLTSEMIQNEGQTCTLKEDLSFVKWKYDEQEWESVTPEDGDEYCLFYQLNDADFVQSGANYYPRFDYSVQDGSATSASQCDFAAVTDIQLVLSGTTLTVPDDVRFTNLQSMFRQKLTFKNSANETVTPTIKSFSIDTEKGTLISYHNPTCNIAGSPEKYQTSSIIVNPVISLDGNIYLSLAFYYPDESSKNDKFILTAVDTEGNVYRCIKAVPDGFANGKYYYGNAELAWTEPHITNLASLTGDYTANNGEVLTGTLSGEYKISIPDNAVVTLEGVSINADGSMVDGEFAGITCMGNATIILANGTTNTVKGFYEDWPGIWIRRNYTLTIKGTGSLDVSSNGWGAGIGGGVSAYCGNIRIEGGNITATGGTNSAGIGAGSWDCGDITITGGHITATGYAGGTGIGGGYQAPCGNITISGGTIIATSDESGAGIGSGEFAACENIIISGGTITATGGSDGAGIGAGIMGTCGDITISGGSITSTGGMDGAGIGIGNEAECGNIYISGGTIAAIGMSDGAGIGCSGQGKCGTIEITSGVDQVTATRGNNSTHSIGFGLKSGDESFITCGSVSIGGTVYWDGSVYQNDGDFYLSVSPFIYPAP